MRPGADQAHGLGDGLGQAHRGQLGRCLAGKRLELGDDLPHALRGLLDQVEVFPCLADLVARQQHAGVGRQGGQCRQRLVEFVRQPGGHLPQRCQLAGLDGVIAGFAQDALGGFQLCQPLLELGRTLDHLGFEPGMGGPQFIGSQQAFGLAPVALPEQVSHGRHQGAGEAGQ